MLAPAGVLYGMRSVTTRRIQQASMLGQVELWEQAVAAHSQGPPVALVQHCRGQHRAAPQAGQQGNAA